MDRKEAMDKALQALQAMQMASLACGIDATKETEALRILSATVPDGIPEFVTAPMDEIKPLEHRLSFQTWDLGFPKHPHVRWRFDSIITKDGER